MNKKYKEVVITFMDDSVYEFFFTEEEFIDFCRYMEDVPYLKAFINVKAELVPIHNIKLIKL